jgi:ABC-type polysaccharide/polyol phosphate export permease
VVRASPFTPYVLAYQATLFAGEAPALGVWLQMAAVALVCWAAGAWVFGRLRDTLAEAV